GVRTPAARHAAEAAGGRMTGIHFEFPSHARVHDDVRVTRRQLPVPERRRVFGVPIIARRFNWPPRGAVSSLTIGPAVA
ncbi:hypothetical protein ACFQ07_06025, partial [Actinomadura adrarensis]